MEQITIVVTYTGYVSDIKSIDRHKLESEIEDKFRNSMDRICIDPLSGQDDDDMLDFDLQDVHAATNLVLGTGWNNK